MAQISMSETFELIRSGALVGAVEEEKVEQEEKPIELKKQLSDMQSEDVMETVKFPNFTGILTQTETLTADVSENFYQAAAP